MSLKFLAVAVVGVAALSAPAQAQIGIEFGIGRPVYGAPRYYEPPAYRRQIERRVYRDRPVIADDDEECRVIVRRRVNRFGEVVIRRVRVCD